MINQDDPSMGEFVPASMLKPAAPLEVLNAALLVECTGDRVSLTFRGFAAKSGYQARVAMDRATWRQFCQQWIDAPKGGQS